ncbi:MAG: LytR/AlgR family response regulator transcription factor [Spirosomataceae bacterium]
MKNLTTSTGRYITLARRKQINTADIIMLEADVNYTKIYLNSGQSLLVAITLKRFESQFLQQPSFFRTHKSYIINLAYVADFAEDINMKNQKKVTVSRRRRPEFIERIKQVNV